ncbi:hypothetical protein FACS1894102_5650 [Spirochaetia bacterium]|nr:hypothetical protein FACS1894102_5650 [Spirochaetia bacterium]
MADKVDNKTGNYIYKPEYIEKMKAAGTPVVELKEKTEFSYDSIRSSVIKEYGAFYFYNEIAKDIGLIGILENIFPDNWREYFNLACYLVSTGDPMMYCKQ